jgi:glycosyltransferase involved in cell wall biosynthesis
MEYDLRKDIGLGGGEMLSGKRVIVVVPAYRAERTIERTLTEIDRSVVDEIIVVDDASGDATAELANACGVSVVRHKANAGYGANQKTCYTEALRLGGEIIVMVHADYQYSPRLIPALAGLVASGHYDVALGSRILGGGAKEGGMPWWRYGANRVLTAIENLLLGQKISEYHTGLRAWSREVLTMLPLNDLSDDFVFDSQTLALAIVAQAAIGEVSCPTRYMSDASSINFWRSIRYGLGVLGVSLAGHRALHGRPRGVFTAIGELRTPSSLLVKAASK